MKILESVKEDVADLAHMLGYERTGVKTQDHPEDAKGEFSDGIEVRNRDENEIPTEPTMKIPYVPCSYSWAEEEERNTDEEGPRMIDEQPLDEAVEINSLSILENFNLATMTIRGITPFSVAYDWELPALLPGTLGETKNAELEQQWVKWDDVLKLLWSGLVKARDRMQNQSDSNRNGVVYVVNDYGFLKIPALRTSSIKNRQKGLANILFVGPYRIKRRLEDKSFFPCGKY